MYMPKDEVTQRSKRLNVRRTYWFWFCLRAESGDACSVKEGMVASQFVAARAKINETTVRKRSIFPACFSMSTPLSPRKGHRVDCIAKSPSILYTALILFYRPLSLQMNAIDDEDNVTMKPAQGSCPQTSAVIPEWKID
jgi:hypothetical protein